MEDLAIMRQFFCFTSLYYPDVMGHCSTTLVLILKWLGHVMRYCLQFAAKMKKIQDFKRLNVTILDILMGQSYKSMTVFYDFHKKSIFLGDKTCFLGV